MTKESIENWLCENFNVDPERERLSVVEHTGHDVVNFIEKFTKSSYFVRELLMDFAENEMFVEDKSYARYMADSYIVEHVMSFDDLKLLVSNITKEDLTNIDNVIVEVVSSYGGMTVSEIRLCNILDFIDSTDKIVNVDYRMYVVRKQ